MRGFNLPDLELYYLANQALYLHRIVKHTDEEQWIQVENAQVCPQNLFSYLFSKTEKNTSANFMVRINNNNLLKSRNLWNQDLGREDINSKWEQCWNITRDITVNENLRLIQYKIMYRIYCARDKMHKYDGKVSNNCLKCRTPDSLVHAFWECYKVQKIWLEIENWLSEALGTKLHFHQSLCILQDVSNNNMHFPQKWIILFSSLILKKPILQHWKFTYPPSLNHWKNELSFYLNMEKLIATEKNKVTQFENIWGKVLQVLRP